MADGERVATASIAPAAPSAWPVTDLVEENGGAFLRDTDLIASVSAASFDRVPVPWALR